MIKKTQLEWQPHCKDTKLDRVYLSAPHMSGLEEHFVADAFAGNWISSLGPHVDAFELEFAEAVGARHAVALSSGTAALHLALILAGAAPERLCVGRPVA